MKKARQLLAFLLAMTMVLTSMSFAVFAEDEIAEEPVIVNHPEHPTNLGIDSSAANALRAKGYSKSILIAGLDAGNRADVILLLCYNETSHEGKMFSVSRETYMQLNNAKAYTIDGKTRDFGKCNWASEFGGMEVLTRELNRHLDLNITQYIGITWQGVADLADAMNGIDGNIDSPEMLALINGLIGSKADPISHTGNVKLYGWQAVEYLRVRKQDGNEGSLKREDRSRDTFKQLFDRARNMSWLDVLRVYAAVSDDIQTNMTVAEMKDNLKLIVKEQGGNATVTDVFKKTNGSFPSKYTKMWDADGLYYYYVPNTLKSTVVELHKNVFGQNKYKISKTATALDKKINTLKKKTIKKKRPTLSDAAVSLSKSSAAYTGNALTPDVSVSLGGRNFREGVDYSTGYNNNVNPGIATVTVKGLPPTYDGQSKSVSFNILPIATDGLQAEGIAKGFTAAWNEAAGPVHGYQVQYGLKSNFKGAKSKTVAGISNTSLKVTKLKTGKTYYVRVRTYVICSVKKGKKTNKITLYSSWSSPTAVKTN